MAWEISMSAEGWDNVRRNLHGMDKDSLTIALTDDLFEDLEQRGVELSDIELAIAHKTSELKSLPIDILAEAAMDLVRQHNTCDNGGFRVWIDRQGYQTVPVDLTPEGEDILVDNR